MTLSSRIASRTFIQKRELMAQSGIDIAFWSAYSRVYDGLLKLGPYADLIADSVDRLKVTNGAVVADLGCGTGNCLNRVISTFGELPNELLGVDTSLQMLDSARRKLGHDPRVKLKEQSLLDWLDDRGVESIDCAVSVNVLYTMQHRERERFWKGLSKALRSGGNAVVVTTDRPGIGPVAKEHFSRVPLWRAFPPRLVAVLAMNMVIWMLESNDVYDPASLDTLVSEAESAGLTVVETKRCYGGEADGVDVMLVLERG